MDADDLGRIDDAPPQAVEQNCKSFDRSKGADHVTLRAFANGGFEVADRCPIDVQDGARTEGAEYGQVYGGQVRCKLEVAAVSWIPPLALLGFFAGSLPGLGPLFPDMLASHAKIQLERESLARVKPTYGLTFASIAT